MMQDLALRPTDLTAFRDGCLMAGYDADTIEVRAERPAAQPNCAGCVICIVHGDYALSFFASEGADWTTRALRAVWEGRCGPRVRRAVPTTKPWAEHAAMPRQTWP